MRFSLALLALCLTTAPALAHVTITPTMAAPGARVAAQFRIGHGCSAAAQTSTALTVQLPPSLTAVEPVAPPGWSVAVVRIGTRTSAITWKGGEVREGQVTLFPVSFVLPKDSGTLAFPAVQICGAEKAEWTQLPNGTAKLEKPAPLLTVAGDAAAVAPSNLVVRDGWFRSLPANLPAGGYFTLRNNGTEKMVLTGAESPACGMLMAHRTTGGSVSSMVSVASVDVEPRSAVSFVPNGLHLMCMQPAAAMKPGNSVPVTLIFQGGARVTTNFAVRDATGK